MVQQNTSTTPGPFIAVQVADGGLWHAGIASSYDEGHASTLCGRWGWVDHRADSTPLPATSDARVPADEAQQVECLTCSHLCDRARVERAEAILAEARARALDYPADSAPTDDTWDYAFAAATNAHRLAEAATEGRLVAEVDAFLAEPIDQWLACDGDIRFDLPETAEARKAWAL